MKMLVDLGKVLLFNQKSILIETREFKGKIQDLDELSQRNSLLRVEFQKWSFGWRVGH